MIIDGRTFSKQMQEKMDREAKKEQEKRERKAERIISRAIRGKMFHTGAIPNYEEMEFKTGFVFQARWQLKDTIKRIASSKYWKVFELPNSVMKKKNIKPRTSNHAVFFIFPDIDEN